MELKTPDTALWAFDTPPNWDDIVAHFPHATRKGVFFAYGGTIYSPSRVLPTSDIVVHERVHFRQQGNDPEAWWDEYILDPAFRLEMEVEAYRAQLSFIRVAYGREQRRKAERNIVKALCSPLYGNLIDPDTARERLVA